MFLVGQAFGYARPAKLEMWALTLPQVAATLLGHQTLNEAGVRLLDEKMLNAVLVLLVVTSILGPLMTELLDAQADQAGGERTGCGCGCLTGRNLGAFSLV